MERGGNDVDERTQRSASHAVVEAVASAEGVPTDALCPPEYEPLNSVIDPDALDSLFADRPDGRHRSGGTVSFVYCGYRILVEPNGSVTVEPRSGLEGFEDS
ncbi:hypothetical protein EA462_09555 [Natrarchaeobius halalkaliphilus]|uniref:Halobacterial output domain-containing protein n=1 Tax=Natrarchaeobius halalkaliphilus TaxID=1679091 RepID=A0A3N6M311_9EURY|nr:HalOD1 output domain-containing protein [Natrarchaeobius halalkaliphilus]RQG90220.1 hypothetical protein EA462_09555 [Natrarchaeobius halalkaliphilus]